jgi:hypothetical protein
MTVPGDLTIRYCQAICGTCVATTFFTIAVAAWPYAADHDNYLKLVSEAQLFLTLLLSTVLQTKQDAVDHDAHDEANYDTVLVLIFFATPLLYVAFNGTSLFRYARRRRRAKK